ncbi:hypothetical protein [Floridanema aerugineum]|uniref:Uncharacterized protein n=1 Tax=Floridaenema aerugineum BLCC-F46 TaxID=3153654 RepID=A0ABV4XAK7_9CYAN
MKVHLQRNLIPTTRTIINDDAVVEFSQATYQVNEDGTVIGAAITINRTGDTSSAGSVLVNLSNGTATGGIERTPTKSEIIVGDSCARKP